eukprot:1162020-Pelagomonas_calceolata.AAC.3
MRGARGSRMPPAPHIGVKYQQGRLPKTKKIDTDTTRARGRGSAAVGCPTKRGPEGGWVSVVDAITDVWPEGEDT